MTKNKALEELYQLLDNLYNDRDDLADLARESNLSLADVVSGETASEFLRNIVFEAHRQSKVEDLIKTAAFEWSEQAVAIKETYELYEEGVGLATNEEIAPAHPSPSNMDHDQPSASTNEGSVGGAIHVGDIEGTGVAVGRGAKAIVNNVYKSVNNTVNQLSSRALWSGAIGIALISLILFWQYFGNQVSAYFTPLWMDKTFNIAVVEFGEIQTSGKISSSAEGSDMSKWLFTGLFGSYEQFNEEIKDSIGIVHKSSAEAAGQGRKLAPLLFVEPAARCEAAEKLASEINAQMLIYGTLDKRTKPAQFELAFYVSPDVQTWLAVNNLQTGISEDSTDCLPLGEALPVPLPFSNAIIRDRISTDVSGQGMLLFWLTLGLIQDQQGESQKAIQYFGRLKDNLASLSRHDAVRYGMVQT